MIMTPSNRFLLLLASLSFAAAIARADVSPAGESSRDRVNFNAGWSFQKGDPEGTGDSLSYFRNSAVKDAVIASASENGLAPDQNRLGAGVSYTRPDFDDKGWRKLDLPHDWGVEGPFDIALEGRTGKLPWAGVAWYRKRFNLPASDAGKRLSLEIDGAMAYPMVWCNGKFVGGWPYGYNSFSLDLTPYLNPGGENVIAVRLDNPEKSSRWYPGGGIYRNVWLTKTAPVHVAHWGTTVTTPKVSPERAAVKLKALVRNEGKKTATVTATTRIMGLDDRDSKASSPVVTMTSPSVKIEAGKSGTMEFDGTIANPRLWDISNPHRYVAVTSLSVGGKVVDRYETPFGIRDIKFTADNGFLLNGKRVQLQGVCNHHDLGALGAAFNERAAERQLGILKDMGVNALRTSHNMPAPELLDLCDRMGIVVMDESFDCWTKAKTPNDYAKLWKDWHEKDLRAELKRDRNHPSVIMWSLGNEIPEQGKTETVPIAEEMVRIAREEDPTRPAALGGNGLTRWDPRFAAQFQLLGQNYESGNYAKIRDQNPGKPLFGSETASCISSRGEYFFNSEKDVEAKYQDEVSKAQSQGKPVPKKPDFKPVPEKKSEGKADFQVSSYDLYAPAWAEPPEQEFKSLDQNPFTAGEFVWTGSDYLGEPTPYTSDITNLLNFRDDPAKRAEYEKELKEFGKVKCPARSSYFGIIDLCGFPKDRFYLYQARWRPDLPMAHILPHWNWPDRVGKVTPVHVYTSGDEAELFLNGKSLGRKKKGPFEYRLRWDDVVYQPGELKAVAYKDGKKWAEDMVKTTGPASRLLLRPDRPSISSDGKDLGFVTVTVADQEGLRVPRAKNPITFSVSGSGEIVATDNGDATDLTSFPTPERKAFNGLCLVIVRAKKGESGPITLKASSEGLTSGETTITAR